jgi:gluconate 5-dehydrogenase
VADLARFDLTDRTALITGAAQGIGFALARGLGQAGATLVLNDIDAPRLDLALEELRRAGLVVEGQVFDVRDAEEVEAGVAAVEERVGPIEILVNNAGIQYREPLWRSRPSPGTTSSRRISAGSSSWARRWPAG